MDWEIKRALLATAAAALYLLLASPGLRADTDCLACHGDKDLKDAAGHSLFVDAARQKAGVHGGLACGDCHTNIKEYPHPKKIAKVECAACHEEQARAVPASAHGALGAEACQSCHGPAHYAQPAAALVPQLCAQCHGSEVKELASSVHGAAAKKGDPQSPNCSSCHGPVHRILPADNPQSSVAKKNLPDTCAACHSNPEFVARHSIPFAHPVEAYRLSVHGRAVAAGNTAAATCSDCHGSHGILPDQNPRSKINHWNVPATCAACHSEIAKVYNQSIHGQAVARGSPDAPVCTDCHGEHVILAPENPQSPVSPARVSTVTCGRCHNNELLDARYNLPTNRMPTYAESYHGLESSAGSQTVANCASCHGVHNIFPSSDPRSTVNSANLGRTCGKCHPGAGTKFAIGPIHVGAQTDKAPAVLWIRWLYWGIIPFAVGFMFLHHLLDFLKKYRRRGPRAESGSELPRMNLNFRIAHWLVVVSFPVLVISGFALKFPGAWWAQPLVVWESRFLFRGLVHRVAAVVLVAAVVYHVIHLLLVKRDRAILGAMIPGARDARDLVDMLGYNLGLRAAPPAFGKFNYVEKVEYLAFLWGTAVMAASGFSLWFNNYMLRNFPKWVLDAATALHYYEAILATFSILIWHMYTVVFDPDVYPMDRAWLTGMASADHLRHTRPEYYAELRRADKSREQSGQQQSGAPWEKGKNPAGSSASKTPSEGKEK